MNQIGKEIQKFLWKGGKTNSKKFHLINLNNARNLKEYGGLGTKHHHLVNLSQGDKIPWKAIQEMKELWKNALAKKCLDANRKRIMLG